MYANVKGNVWAFKRAPKQVVVTDGGQKISELTEKPRKYG